jgi:hypothetical protein
MSFLLKPVSLQFATAAQNEVKLFWLIIAPLGGPVVPDV